MVLHELLPTKKRKNLFNDIINLFNVVFCYFLDVDDGGGGGGG